MGRTPCCQKVGLKKGRWTAEEDEILMKYIQTNGEGSWRSLPKNAGLLRCGKSCRLRWINYLRSDLKRGNITAEEENTIVKLHSSLGNRWSLIAAHLPGRTDNEIKNYWNSRLSRRIHYFRRCGDQSGLPSILMDSTKFGKRRAGRTARSAMRKKAIYTNMNSTSNAAVATSSIKKNGVNPSSEAAVCDRGLQSINGVIMEEEVSLNTDRILISFNEVMDAVDQGRESHDEVLKRNKGTTTSEEMENGIASSNGENGEWYCSSSSNMTGCFDDRCWVDWDWNAGFALAAAEDIDRSSSGTAMWANEGEEMMSWLWEEDDVLGAGITVEECEQQQPQSLAAWFLS
ncbi:hypothetical protein NE237_012371 [Protea cynaroides]|uniref:Uncharacterized protein n=1 Tax=Protea cynaroides TaxID=273540 RepID=A0A9Q0GXD5_9MAGN|nr:hypothetical protein NE237_012371 [Protea cynaroides]